jgi:D-3-phosphoglycerate dehydrogenase
MLDEQPIAKLKDGAEVINVVRGLLIDEQAIIVALQSGHISAAALDVFEDEPSPLREMPQSIFGSHNGSNTKEAVRKTTFVAINKIAVFLNGEYLNGNE